MFEFEPEPYRGECVEQCSECPVADRSPETLQAVRLMANIFDPHVMDSLPVGTEGQMVRTAEEIVEVTGAPLDDAGPVAAAVARRIRSYYEDGACPNSNRSVAI